MLTATLDFSMSEAVIRSVGSDTHHLAAAHGVSVLVAPFLARNIDPSLLTVQAVAVPL